MCFSPQRRAIFSRTLSFLTFWLQNVLFATAACIFQHQNVKMCSKHVVFYTFWLQNVLLATAACNFSPSELQKVSMWCFIHFDFKMCFSPQPRAIFRHLNFKKWSETGVFCTCSLQNVLFATAACNFWFLLWPHDSAPAALTGLLFDWPDTQIIEKTQHFATSLTFGAGVSSFFWLSRYCIFFLLTWLLYSAFQLSLLSEVWLLNFLRIMVICLQLSQLAWGLCCVCWVEISHSKHHTTTICPHPLGHPTELPMLLRFPRLQHPRGPRQELLRRWCHHPPWAHGALLTPTSDRQMFQTETIHDDTRWYIMINDKCYFVSIFMRLYYSRMNDELPETTLDWSQLQESHEPLHKRNLKS